MGEEPGTAPENGHLVTLRAVTKSFSSHVVLDHIDLAVARGEAIVVAGPSGSGKSTIHQRARDDRFG